MDATQRTPILLVSTATHWLGTARIPRGLARAGFEVALLTPRDTLAEKSRYVTRIGYLPDGATPRQWVQSLAAMEQAVAPRLLVPCDDMAFRLLAWLAVAPPPELRADLRERLVKLVHASLGDPAHFLPSVDKTQLPAVAASLGIAMPPHAIVRDAGEALAFADGNGYPVVLKRAHAFAGQGVAICAERAGLERAVRAFAQADQLDPLATARQDRLLIQSHVDGPIRYCHAVASGGDVVAGFSLEKVVANPSPTGPPTVTRYFHAADLHAITERLARGLRISGFFFAEFIVDRARGAPLLLEINRRISPATHRGEARGVDLCAALHGAVHQRPSTSRTRLDDSEEGLSVHFPQEWLRDPASRYLREHPQDVPWDEPELLEALLAMRHMA